MRDIYLIDFENVASEGLSGITYLTEDDQVVIFYSANSNRLTMKMHILIGKSVCDLQYLEATVGGKNALDHQISTWLGYLVGTNAADRSYYIVSKDMGYKHVASFWNSTPMKPHIRCIDSIRSASRADRRRMTQQVLTAELGAVEASVAKEKAHAEDEALREAEKAAELDDIAVQTTEPAAAAFPAEAPAAPVSAVPAELPSAGSLPAAEPAPAVPVMETPATPVEAPVSEFVPEVVHEASEAVESAPASAEETPAAPTAEDSAVNEAVETSAEPAITAEVSVVETPAAPAIEVIPAEAAEAAALPAAEEASVPAEQTAPASTPVAPIQAAAALAAAEAEALAAQDAEELEALAEAQTQTPRNGRNRSRNRSRSRKPRAAGTQEEASSPAAAAEPAPQQKTETSESQKPQKNGQNQKKQRPQKKQPAVQAPIDAPEAGEPAAAQPEKAENAEKTENAERRSNRSRSQRQRKNDRSEKPQTAEKAEFAPQPEQKPLPTAEAQPAESRQTDRKPRRTVALGELLKPYPTISESYLTELISSGKKQVLCNHLRKQLGQEKGLALYNEIKRLAWR